MMFLTQVSLQAAGADSTSVFTADENLVFGIVDKVLFHGVVRAGCCLCCLGIRDGTDKTFPHECNVSEIA